MKPVGDKILVRRYGDLLWARVVSSEAGNWKLPIYVLVCIYMLSTYNIYIDLCISIVFWTSLKFYDLLELLMQNGIALFFLL